MKTILITGFDPFNKETTNPSFEAVKLLKDNIDGVIIIKKEIPTVFYKSKEILDLLIEKYNPDVVINVGQAGGRKSISIEKQAFNLMNAPIPDNEGNQPVNKIISNDTEEILKSSLPINEMVDALKDNNIDAYISDSAGRYVCNYVMYSMLLKSKTNKFISGFIHVPFSKEQVIDKDKNIPYMEIIDMSKALEICIQTIIKKANSR